MRAFKEDSDGEVNVLPCAPHKTHRNSLDFMSLNDDDISRLARLAQIALDPKDRAKAIVDLEAIITMVDAMQAIDTEGVEPLAHPLDATQRLRDDVVDEVQERDRYLALAPQTENGLYLVPRVIE
jgi:aspartyl-tRNA(Asn)/glutamyl-tRNA(Gln) amidotransferase subunit C